MIPITCHSSKMARTTTTDIEIDLRNFPGFCDLFSVICQIFVSRLQSDSEFEVENTEVAVNNRTSSILRSVHSSSCVRLQRKISRDNLSGEIHSLTLFIAFYHVTSSRTQGSLSSDRDDTTSPTSPCTRILADKGPSLQKCAFSNRWPIYQGRDDWNVCSGSQTEDSNSDSPQW